MICVLHMVFGQLVVVLSHAGRHHAQEQLASLWFPSTEPRLQKSGHDAMGFGIELGVFDLYATSSQSPHLGSIMTSPHICTLSYHTEFKGFVSRK